MSTPITSCSFPRLTTAVGTTPYVSKYTGKVEQLPAAVGFIAAKGSDVMLADFVGDLFNDDSKALDEL